MLNRVTPQGRKVSGAMAIELPIGRRTAGGALHEHPHLTAKVAAVT